MRKGGDDMRGVPFTDRIRNAADLRESDKEELLAILYQASKKHDVEASDRMYSVKCALKIELTE